MQITAFIYPARSNPPSRHVRLLSSADARQHQPISPALKRLTPSSGQSFLPSTPAAICGSSQFLDAYPSIVNHLVPSLFHLQHYQCGCDLSVNKRPFRQPRPCSPVDTNSL
ncbi:hypothetical protein IF2G_04776 [Cordyceps javanica]|nr:hypothetical protein IF2G_04776 [Cordyceps javanica]